jgi:hypothetical protein
MNTAISKQAFTDLVRGFHFKELFNQMGWDNTSGTMNLPVENIAYRIETISEKKGFKVLQCKSPIGYPIPDANLRIKINAQLKKLHYEHLLIFTDESRKKQIWLYSYKPVGKSAKPITTEYDITQTPQLLYQRTGNLVFELEDEDNVTLVDVTSKIAANIDQNVEKVTKKFYTDFKEQHKNFLKHLQGISEELDRNWYASVMLNRLMFCYFIQKQGFLDSNIHYLSEKLQTCQLEHGRDKFYSFYRTFLLKLFHQGLGAPHGDEPKVEFGKIPYLNGGIFSEHELEAKYGKDIAIDDTAFESLFQLFDKYNWHLDTRVTATGKDINPDVIGYIFEKYINDRAEMGAYYTKEDITDYIGKNTILPWLFDETQRKHKEPFMPDGEVWQKLKESGDQYIYPAIKHGVNHADIWHDLPNDIRAALNPEQPDLVEKRRCWNQPAPEDVALPTEIWREVIARRQRYLELRDIIQSGQICQINDLITYNLNIRQFTYDLLEETDDIRLIHQFYKTLKKITILDPTCGSGAFLFAAMNILEELYEVCLDRMDAYVQKYPQRNNAHLNAELAPLKSDAHPNRQYFIYKSIILNNLYGVDIMNEAVEIAKLRLFLKLVACVDHKSDDDNFGLEPLPDVDFNIRSGNTLIGYANWDEIEKDITSDAISAAENKALIPELCQKVAMAFNRYKEIQIDGYENHINFVDAKKELQKTLNILTERLDAMLHQQSSSRSYCVWKKTHLPFHWYAEFYEIIEDRKGFEVVIGNPPYVEINKNIDYNLDHYLTNSCGNLYAPVIERCHHIQKNGRMGIILPLASFATNRMLPLQDIIKKHDSALWLSNYEATSNPSVLFVGVKIQLSIIITNKNSSIEDLYTTCYNRTYSTERQFLFDRLQYASTSPYSTRISKSSSRFDERIIQKLFNHKATLIHHLRKYGACEVYFRSMGNFFFKIAFTKEPEYYKDSIIQHSSTVGSFSVDNPATQKSIVALINSTIFYYYWIMFSDCYHLSKKDIVSFPLDFDNVNDDVIQELVRLCNAYLVSLESCAVWQTEVSKSGSIKKYRRYFPQNCILLANQIDKCLSVIYDLTPVELDYMVNYDIKYRLGGATGSDGDD